MRIPKDVEKAYKSARIARSKAHAPYSKFKVGAAVKLKGVAEAVVGCNVENASYGGAICAERTALVSAVASHGGGISPEFIVVVTGEAKATVPCAFCLQVMAEFCDDDMKIYMGNEKEILSAKKFSEMLPFPFRSFSPDRAK